MREARQLLIEIVQEWREAMRTLRVPQPRVER